MNKYIYYLLKIYYLGINIGVGDIRESEINVLFLQRILFVGGESQINNYNIMYRRILKYMKCYGNDN